MKFNKLMRVVLVCIFFFSLFALVYPRAGGGGGYSGGGGSFSSSSFSGSGGSGGELGGGGLLVIIVIIGIVIMFSDKNRSSTINSYGDYNDVTLRKRKKIPGKDKFDERNPNFEVQKFYEKVRKSFIEIQNAWQKQDLSDVRRFISDGVYQRFNVQFKMMKELSQSNKISHLQILDMTIDKCETDGEYDIIHVGIMANITDHFICEKYPSLNEGGSEKFVEYWSFIRKKDTEEFDLYNSNKCPKCSADLPDKTGEVSKCEYCGSYTNRGNFDWIVSEITQLDDYLNEGSDHSSLKNKVEKLEKGNNDFSVQLLEDKVSNGYLQILMANAFNKPELMRRFVSDSFYNKYLENKVEKYFYNRLYLNHMTLLDIMESDNKNILAVKVKASFQRIRIKNNALKMLDSFMNSSTKIIILEREKGAVLAKGDLYSHTCPNCAGALDDTTDVKCPYCDAVLTSSKYEWIIKDIVSTKEYAMNYLVNSSISNKQLDENAKVNEIILNNILVVLAADGKICDEEIIFAKGIAKKLGFKPEKLNMLFELAGQKRLSLKTPFDDKSKLKVLKYMKDAMYADGVVTEEEKAVIKEIEEIYL